jgi:hypothetical protein
MKQSTTRLLRLLGEPPLHPLAAQPLVRRRPLPPRLGVRPPREHAAPARLDARRAAVAVRLGAVGDGPLLVEGVAAERTALDAREALKGGEALPVEDVAAGKQHLFWCRLLSAVSGVRREGL